MNIFEAKNELLNYFKENEIFELSKFNQTFLLLEDLELNKKIIELAADELCDTKILKKITLPDNNIYYVLVQPLDTYSQSVELNYSTCMAISSIVNDYCDNVGDKENLCDPLFIRDRDISNFIKLYLTLLKGNDSDE